MAGAVLPSRQCAEIDRGPAAVKERVASGLYVGRPTRSKDHQRAGDLSRCVDRIGGARAQIGPGATRVQIGIVGSSELAGLIIDASDQLIAVVDAVDIVPRDAAAIAARGGRARHAEHRQRAAAVGEADDRRSWATERECIDPPYNSAA